MGRAFAAFGEACKLNDDDAAGKGQSEDVPGADAGMGFVGRLAVDADGAGGDEGGGEGAGFAETGEDEEFVQALPGDVFVGHAGQAVLLRAARAAKGLSGFGAGSGGGALRTGVILRRASIGGAGGP